MAEKFFDEFLANLLPKLNSEGNWSARISTADDSASVGDEDANALAVLLLDATKGSPKSISFSCVARDQSPDTCTLWETEVNAEVLQSHRKNLGISGMTIDAFFPHFWNAIHTATLDEEDSTVRALLLDYTIMEGVVLSGRLPMEKKCAVPSVVFPMLWKLQASGAGSSIVRQPSQPSSASTLSSSYSASAPSQSSQPLSQQSAHASPAKRKIGASQSSTQDSPSSSLQQSQPAAAPVAAPPRKKGRRRRKLKTGGATFD
eukprot:INCI2304.1.p1 GENE.INCI2304.1~~INCI2304.1.p1  ORF type:complete len:286 (-),score=35.64 INCI2304.1:375-1154(-)